MRILDSRTVQQRPMHQVHLELTDEELGRIRGDLLNYSLPSSIRNLASTVTGHFPPTTRTRL